MPSDDVSYSGSNKLLKIVIVVDPAGRQRGVFWPEEVDLYNAADDLRSGCKLPKPMRKLSA